MDNYKLYINTVYTLKSNNYRVDNNVFCNQPNILNGIITLDMLDQQFERKKYYSNRKINPHATNTMKPVNRV